MWLCNILVWTARWLGCQRQFRGERREIIASQAQLFAWFLKKLEETLMSEGLAKFADPQKALLKLIADKRAQLRKV